MIGLAVSMDVKTYKSGRRLQRNWKLRYIVERRTRIKNNANRYLSIILSIPESIYRLTIWSNVCNTFI